MVEDTLIVDNPMKEWLVHYVGDKLKPENGEINVAMIVDAMAQEFPEFVMALAEENWLRGYQQALHDIDHTPPNKSESTNEVE